MYHTPDGIALNARYIAEISPIVLEMRNERQWGFRIMMAGGRGHNVDSLFEEDAKCARMAVLTAVDYVG